MSYKENTGRIKAHWVEYLEAMTRPAKYKVNGRESYVCPICGHGDGGDGLTFIPGTDTLKCFGCGFTGSDIDLDIKVYGGNVDDRRDFMEARQRVADIVGVDLYDENAQESAPKTPYKTTKGDTAINRPVKEKKLSEADLSASRAIIERAQANFNDPACIKYLESRGIDIETARRAGVGFIKDFKHPSIDPEKAQYIPARPYLIYPNSSGGCTARATDPETPKQYQKRLVKPEGLFFLEGLDTSKRLFVVEGEADALTIIQSGAQAVATCSTTGIDRFMDWITDHWPKDGAELVLCYDQDDDGRREEHKLMEKLQSAHIPALSFNLSGEYKDPNEAYNEDRAGFLARLHYAQTMDAPDPQAEVKEKVHSWTIAGRMPDFEEFLKNSAPPTPTGFPTLDELLNGGIREGLIVIGAVSSLGKTTFMVQMLDQIISNAWKEDQDADQLDPNKRRDALFFSLEESYTSLIARMISRRTAESAVKEGKAMDGNAKRSDQLLDYYRLKEFWSEEDLRRIDSAQRDVMQIGEKFGIIDGRPVSALEVREAVEEYKTATGRAPIVLIDYLQIMRPMNPKSDLRNSINENLTELANLSHEYHTPIIVISSFNRDSYNQGVTFSSGKESGNIEYSADLYMGLQFQGVGGKNFDERKARKQEIRKIELVIMKQRGGGTGRIINFDYVPTYNLFTDRGIKPE